MSRVCKGDGKHFDNHRARSFLAFKTFVVLRKHVITRVVFLDGNPES